MKENLNLKKLKKILKISILKTSVSKISILNSIGLKILKSAEKQNNRNF
jgi:hypothetical protein